MIKGDRDPISTIKIITPEITAKLAAEGIVDTIQLLENADTSAKRKELAKKLGISNTELKELVNRADLMRVKGVGGAFAHLLEEAGVNSVKELSHRTPDNLFKKLVEIQNERKLAHHAPKLEQVTIWVEDAKSLVGSVEEDD